VQPSFRTLGAFALTGFQCTILNFRRNQPAAAALRIELLGVE
jgi:hypothetical protein